MPRVTAFRSEKIKKPLLDPLQGDRYASQGICREQSAEYAVVWLFSCQEFILVKNRYRQLTSFRVMNRGIIRTSITPDVSIATIAHPLEPAKGITSNEGLRPAGIRHGA